MGIGAIGIEPMSSYRISSVYGNPVAFEPISPISEETKANKALIIAQKEKDDIYVKAYGNLDSTTSTLTGEFADLLSVQESYQDISSKSQFNVQSTNAYMTEINDTIGLMGFQNRLRNQLAGVDFRPFE